MQIFINSQSVDCKLFTFINKQTNSNATLVYFWSFIQPLTALMRTHFGWNMFAVFCLLVVGFHSLSIFLMRKNISLHFYSFLFLSLLLKIFYHSTSVIVSSNTSVNLYCNDKVIDLFVTITLVIHVKIYLSLP